MARMTQLLMLALVSGWFSLMSTAGAPVCSSAEECDSVSWLQQKGVRRHQAPDWNVYPGQHCGGKSIKQWTSSPVGSTQYGEKSGITNLDDCKSTCFDHAECFGFVHRPGVTLSNQTDHICSFWKEGPLKPYSRQGHTCYEKVANSKSGCDSHWEKVLGHHCKGTSIKKWTSSPVGKTGYGSEDITDLDDCKETCSDHSECAGFVHRPGVTQAGQTDHICAFWKEGPLEPYPRQGHDCYIRKGDPCPE